MSTNQSQTLSALPRTLSVGGKPAHGMDYGTFMATEGGRKCPLCGKYAKKGTVGNLSFICRPGGAIIHVSMYGHLPGYGCNVPDNIGEIRDNEPRTMESG